MKKAPPFPKEQHWLLGSIFFLKDHPIKYITFFAEKYGDIYSLSALLNKVVVISNPEYVKYVLQDNSKNYRKSIAYDVLKLLLGNGILTSEGETWKQNRKLIQPSFHKKKLEDFVQIMQQASLKLIREIKSETAESKQIQIGQYSNRVALEIITKCMFGDSMDMDTTRVSELISMLNKMAIDKINRPFRLAVILPKYFNKKEKIAIDELNTLIYKLIESRRNSQQHHDDLLGMLLDAKDEDSGVSMSDLQIRDELMTIFIAGHETTATAIMWTIYALCKNKEIYKKLENEIDLFQQEINFESIQQSTYLRQVIDESLRYYPPAWSMGRRNYTDDEIGGYQIKAVTNVLVPIYYMHHSPKFWKDPEIFDPERFAPAIKNNINRFVYMPFGAGARMCIANHFAIIEMQVVLINLLKNFHFSCPENYEVELLPQITLHSKQDITLNISLR